MKELMALYTLLVLCFFVEQEVGAAVNGDENGGGCRHGEDRDLVSYTSLSTLVCIKPAVLHMANSSDEQRNNTLTTLYFSTGGNLGIISLQFTSGSRVLSHVT